MHHAGMVSDGTGGTTAHRYGMCSSTSWTACGGCGSVCLRCAMQIDPHSVLTSSTTAPYTCSDASGGPHVCFTSCHGLNMIESDQLGECEAPVLTTTGEKPAKPSHSADGSPCWSTTMSSAVAAADRILEGCTSSALQSSAPAVALPLDAGGLLGVSRPTIARISDLHHHVCRSI